MKKIILKQLTDNSWIMMINGERCGIVSQTNDKLLVVGQQLKSEFLNFDQLAKKLGGKITFELPIEQQSEKEVGEINGYPIKHSNWFNTVLTPIPSYSRTQTSNARYAAGYYGVKFTNGWTPSFCPKLTTLSEYEYIGPFTTKLEMQHQISIKNKVTNV